MYSYLHNMSLSRIVFQASYTFIYSFFRMCIRIWNLLSRGSLILKTRLSRTSEWDLFSPRLQTPTSTMTTWSNRLQSVKTLSTRPYSCWLSAMCTAEFAKLSKWRKLFTFTGIFCILTVLTLVQKVVEVLRSVPEAEGGAVLCGIGTHNEVCQAYSFAEYEFEEYRKGH